MNQDNYIEDELSAKIIAGGKEGEEASMQLFNSLQGFIPTIQGKLNLPLDQVRDAYSDALVKLIRQIKNGSFRGESKLSSYFYSIFYNTAVDVTRKNSTNKNIKTVPLEDYDLRERDLLDMMDIKEDAQRLFVVIDKMGPVCKKILIDWGYHGYNMEEIAERSKLSNASSARSMKYKCLKKLKEFINEKLFTNE